MKINIQTFSNVQETEINIICNQLTPEIERLVSLIRIMDMKFTGEKNGQIHILDISKILYIDTVDKKTFFYTKTDVYETPLRLYELEEQLEGTEFFRANKSCIVNFEQIQSLKSDLDGRILLTMSNNEKLYVSRQYSPFVKKKLGVK
ncbi:LytTR family DNA-binding domain-containing protein [Ruminiclostridium cellobioparum]|uniref:Response regulator of the LytR/AlgR family n=1 Tax=Ruminiclostridium cellobioparum subsp. termitidis CT1112 TaxID=1195236 RepID=S0FH27_RUMCE|nr:LytTR family DNA-binding domain-containing protein [Ruminiclostridium cellobioparum]EMS70627.1 Response regulator of the LytR/AlgR family [Ruminiclostridium cellobioparum subsp. termitidis CT1112]